MRISDVVKQIRAVLPTYTDLFGDIVTINSISAFGGTATITTSSAHGLSTGQAVTIVGVETRTPISAFVQDGLNFTFTTSADHDLTFDWPEHNKIELGGFTDSSWNASFTLTSSDNRRNFKVQSANTAPVLNGNEYLLEDNRVDGLNGVYSITVTGMTTFTVNGDFLDGTYTPINGKVFSAPRVASVINIDRALDEYTKQNLNDFWIFVEPLNVDVSKDRNTFSDATVTIAGGNDIRTRMIDGFTVYIVAPTTDQIAAETALDICRHDLLLPMMRTLYGLALPTGVSNPADFKTTLNGHGVSAYERAFLVYNYEFQVIIDLTEDDMVLPSQTRAFRNIDYTENIGNDDTTDMTITALNLDKVPI